MKRIYQLLLWCASGLTLTACGAGDGGGHKRGEAERPDKLIITAIPDDSAENMREYFGLIARVIEQAAGIPCQYVHVDNYAASVTALATGQAHLSWFGAVTAAQAYMQMKDDLVVIACRDIDKKFVAYFIAHADSGIGEVADLQELADRAEGQNWSFAFGSKSSTSSHLMPRKFFTDQSGRAPEDVFRIVAYSGSHDVVLEKVANGEFHVGALGQPPYERASEATRARAPIIYATPQFTNYCLAGRADLGDELLGKIREALLELHETDEGRRALGYLKAGRFIEADMSEWMGYVELIESGVDIGG